MTHEPTARSTDPETSHAAARSIRDRTTVQDRIVRILERAEGPLIDEEIFDAYRSRYGYISPSGCRSRRAELAAFDVQIIVDSGERGITASGRSAIRWALTGRESQGDDRG